MIPQHDLDDLWREIFVRFEAALGAGGNLARDILESVLNDLKFQGKP